MYRNRHILALIPARGGSKGLFRKNIKPLLGRPLIFWTIEQAKKSKYIDRIIVSTDNKEIAEVSKKYGAEIPFMRPKRLATDKAKSIDVILHTINWLEKKNNVFDLLMSLQPTSPLRTSKDIDAAIELLFKKNAQAIVSVCEAEHHPYLANILSSGGRMNKFLKPEVINMNRQDLPIFYRINGAIYVAYWKHIKRERSFFGGDTYAYIMPKERSVDVDTEIDFKLAEILAGQKLFMQGDR